MQEKYFKEQPKILNIFSIFSSLELWKITLKNLYQLLRATQIYKQDETRQHKQLIPGTASLQVGSSPD